MPNHNCPDCNSHQTLHCWRQSILSNTRSRCACSNCGNPLQLGPGGRWVAYALLVISLTTCTMLMLQLFGLGLYFPVAVIILVFVLGYPISLTVAHLFRGVETREQKEPTGS